METADYLAKSFKNIQDYSNLEIAILIAGMTVILTWLIIITMFVYRLTKRFTYEYVTNPYKDETLGLPRGTFRGLLTITLLVVLIVMVCMSLMIDEFQGNFDSLVGAFEVMIAFYFGSKIMNQVSENDKQKTEMKADAKVKAEMHKSGAGPSSESDFEVLGSQG